MRCTRCGNEMKIKQVETGKDNFGNPVYSEYAFCYQCKIKMNLSKKKAKKQEDLSLTRQFVEQLEMPVAANPEQRADIAAEEPKEELKRRPAPKRKEEKEEKKTAGPEQTRPAKRTAKPEQRPEPEKRRAAKPAEKRAGTKKSVTVGNPRNVVPDVSMKKAKKKSRNKKGGKVVKFLVFLIIIAAIGAAVYFNRDTVKGWIHLGLEKFDQMSDQKDGKAEDGNAEDNAAAPESGTGADDESQDGQTAPDAGTDNGAGSTDNAGDQGTTDGGTTDGAQDAGTTDSGENI